MLNSRTLFPALFNKTGGGGGGSGQTIQVTELPEAVLAEKDKIYQYIGSTTATLTNGYFYKCVEHTETEGGVITVTYEWENIPVMEAEGGGGIEISNTETVVGTYKGKPLYSRVFTNTAIHELGSNRLTIVNSLGVNIDDLVFHTLDIRESDGIHFNFNNEFIMLASNGAILWNGSTTVRINDISQIDYIIFYTKTV